MKVKLIQKIVNFIDLIFVFKKKNQIGEKIKKIVNPYIIETYGNYFYLKKLDNKSLLNLSFKKLNSTSSSGQKIF